MSGEESGAESGPKVVENAWAMKIPEFKPEDNPHSLLEESSFATLFPKYREEYIKKCWPLVVKELAGHQIKAELDLREGSMTVRTTRKTWDPYVVVKARDMIRLISRSVPLEHARRVLSDENGCDIIKIGSLVRNREKFVKRRKRLIGPAGCTLKSIELLTDCHVHVQGQTVAVVGPYKALLQVHRIVEDTMKNVHPIYNIKALMIKRELAKDPNLKNENWERFLPKFDKKNVPKRKEPKRKRAKGAYTPFPPAQPERKIDRMIASGEYFMKEAERRGRARADREKRQSEAERVRQAARNAPFEPPEEPAMTTTAAAGNKLDLDLNQLKTKVDNAQKRRKRQHNNPPQ